MLVVLTDRQILTPQKICHACVLADNQGRPRWKQGHLGCGHRLQKSHDQDPPQYECEMGFRLANIS
jgi:hypothetical protein